MSKTTFPILPPYDVGMSGQVKFAYSQFALQDYADQAARAARRDAIEDVACMLCGRFDLNIPADLGPKLLEAIRSLNIDHTKERP